MLKTIQCDQLQKEKKNLRLKSILLFAYSFLILCWISFISKTIRVVNWALQVCIYVKKVNSDFFLFHFIIYSQQKNIHSFFFFVFAILHFSFACYWVLDVISCHFPFHWFNYFFSIWKAHYICIYLLFGVYLLILVFLFYVSNGFFTIILFFFLSIRLHGFCVLFVFNANHCCIIKFWSSDFA